MKRWISSIVLAGLAAGVMAQAPFTIVRPADNSRVREKVRILIPKDSVPPGGYVGVFLDGKLVEAVVPPVEGKYRVYTLDTKGRGLPDTPAGETVNLELVLYTDYNDQARIVDRSSIDVRIGNLANIPIPNSGVSLRYRFVPGTEMVYAMDQKVQIETITERQQQRGGRAAQFDTESERIRLLYAVDNAYSDGSGLLRLQALPIKGKNYADLTTTDSLQPKRYTTAQMAPLYMRVTNTGHEVFAALPPSVGLFENSAGGADPTSLYASFPLPTLPSKAVRPGDSWASRFQSGNLDLSKYPNIETAVRKIPARGEFVGVEWERGHPCAKIRNVIEQAEISDASGTVQRAAGQPIADDKVSITETIWFALDSRKVLKVVRDTTIDRKNQSAGGFPGLGGMPGGPGGGPPGGPAGMGGEGAATERLMRQRGGRQNVGGGGPAGLGGPTGGPQGAGMGGRPGGMGGAQNQGGATFVRVRILQTFTLE